MEAESVTAPSPQRELPVTEEMVGNGFTVADWVTVAL
jgi:hypothetical protein